LVKIGAPISTIRPGIWAANVQRPKLGNSDANNFKTAEDRAIGSKGSPELLFSAPNFVIVPLGVSPK